MTIHLTYDKVRQLTDEAVAARGADYRYKKPPTRDICLYVHRDADGNKTPGCLVGDVLVRAGVPIDVLDDDSLGPVGSLLYTLPDGMVEIDEDAHDFLSDAQFKQDFGETWGDAVTYALGHRRPR